MPWSCSKGKDCSMPYSYWTYSTKSHNFNKPILWIHFDCQQTQTQCPDGYLMMKDVIMFLNYYIIWHFEIHD